MPANYWTAIPSTNKRLRDDCLAQMDEYGFSGAVKPTTNIGLQSIFGNTLWHSVSGGVWNPTRLPSTSGVYTPPGGSYNRPFCTFSQVSTTVQETTTAFNYGGWSLGQSIVGVSTYSQNFGSFGGTVSFKGSGGSNRTWILRQLVYNSAAQQLAVRMSVSGGVIPSSSTDLYIGIGAYGSTSLQMASAVPAWGGGFNVGGDITGVWVFYGDWSTYMAASNAFICLVERY